MGPVLSSSRLCNTPPENHIGSLLTLLEYCVAVVKAQSTLGENQEEIQEPCPRDADQTLVQQDLLCTLPANEDLAQASPNCVLTCKQPASRRHTYRHLERSRLIPHITPEACPYSYHRADEITGNLTIRCCSLVAAHSVFFFPRTSPLLVPSPMGFDGPALQSVRPTKARRQNCTAALFRPSGPTTFT